MSKRNEKLGTVRYIEFTLRIFRPLLETFAQESGLDVTASCRVNDFESEVCLQDDGDRGVLRIVFWRAPGHRYLENEVESIYGIGLLVSQRSHFFDIGEPGESEKMIFDPCGYPVAMISGQTLYILFPHLGEVERYGVSDTEMIFKRILDDYLLYLKDPKNFEVQMELRSTKPKKRFAEIMIEASKSVFREEWRERVEDLMRGSFYNLAYSAAELSNATKSVAREQVEKMYEDLTAFAVSPDLVEFFAGDIYVPIGQVDIEVDGLVYDIGVLEIMIDMRSHDLKVINRTRMINGLSHPNVDDNGQVQMGEALCGLAILLGRLELVPVMSMVVPFLHNYDFVTCKEPISSWPLKKETKK